MSALASLGVVLLCAGVLLGAHWLERPCTLQPVVAEPAGLARRLLALRDGSLERLLTGELRRRFEEDGVVVVPQALPDTEAREAIARAVWEGGFWPHNVSLTNHWVVNGALRALVRDGPIGALAAWALQAPSVVLAASANWYKPPTKRPGPSAKWHVDDHLTRADGTPAEGAVLVGVWLALTDAPESLEFLLGSHLELHNCPHRVSHTADANQTCIGGEYLNNLTRRRGSPANRTLSLQAGDVVLLHGKAWHRGRSHLKGRLSMSFRLYPAGTLFERELTRDFGTFFYNKFYPKECAPMSGPLFPVLHPPDASDVDRQQWPLSISWGDLAWARASRTWYDIAAFVRGGFKFADCGA